MLVEFEDAVAELVPGTFIVCFGVEKLFKTINVQSSFPLLSPQWPQS